MDEPTLLDRVTRHYEQGHNMCAILAIAEEVEAQGRLLAELLAEYPLSRRQTEQHTVVPPSQGGS